MTFVLVLYHALEFAAVAVQAVTPDECERTAWMERIGMQLDAGRVDLLVRARHDRSLGPRRPKLFAVMGGGAPDGLIDVEVDGLAARPRWSGGC